MKLIIQIPCFNEELTLPSTLADLPRQMDGIEQVEWLVIDDGSTDRTVEVAREHGVDHVVRLTNNRGLAAAFQAGLDASLKLGADIIVNTDADNQYFGGDIPKLVAPILAGDADMVIGDRKTDQIEHFSPLKKRLQRLGSAVVRRASGTNVPDTTSGFRAYNREAALQMQVVSKFTYTLESIIQAGKMLVAVDHVPIRTNEKTRESRLFPSMWSYVRRNTVSIFRIYALYEPLRVFMAAAALAALVGAVIWARFLYFFFFSDDPGQHVQSLILGSTLFIVAVQLAALGVIGDILAGSRVLQQRMLERVRRVELQLGVEPSHYEPGSPRERPAGHHGRAVGPRDRQDRGPRGSASCERRRGGGRGPDRQHLRQVRLVEPGGEAADGRLPLDPRRALGEGGAVVGARRGLRRGRAHARVGRSGSATGASWGSTSRTRSCAPSGRSASGPTSSTGPRRPRGSRSPTTSSTSPSAIEVLEHVPEPEATLAEMARVARGHLLVSVPREPLWRGLNMARGAYWRDLGNTPGHVNHWSKRGFVSLLSRYGTVEEARSPFPWTMLLVRL